MSKAKTKTDLGRLMGVSRSTVYRWIHRDDWKWGDEPWSEEEVRAILQWKAGDLQRPRLAPLDPHDFGGTSGGGDSGGGDSGVASGVGTSGGGLEDLLKRARIALTMSQKKLNDEKHAHMTREKIARDQFNAALMSLAGTFVDIFNQIELTWPDQYGCPRDRIRHDLDHFRQKIVDAANMEKKRAGSDRDER